MSHNSHRKNLGRSYKPVPRWDIASCCVICGKLVERGQAYHASKTKRDTIWVHDECLLNDQRELKTEKEIGS